MLIKIFLMVDELQNTYIYTYMYMHVCIYSDMHINANVLFSFVISNTDQNRDWRMRGSAASGFCR